MARKRSPHARQLRTRLDPAERRAQILDAARRVLARHPYYEVSVAEIAREAGVSRALVNHYFEGKRGMLLELLHELADRAPASVAGQAVSVEAMVSATTDSWLDFVSANRELMLALSGVGPFDPELERLVDELRDRIVDGFLESHFGTTDVQPAARVALRAYTGMFQLAVRDWLCTGAVTREQVHTLLSRELLAIVRDVLPALGTRA